LHVDTIPSCVCYARYSWASPWEWDTNKSVNIDLSGEQKEVSTMAVLYKHQNEFRLLLCPKPVGKAFSAPSAFLAAFVKGTG